MLLVTNVGARWVKFNGNAEYVNKQVPNVVVVAALPVNQNGLLPSLISLDNSASIFNAGVVKFTFISQGHQAQLNRAFSRKISFDTQLVNGLDHNTKVVAQDLAQRLC